MSSARRLARRVTRVAVVAALLLGLFVWSNPATADPVDARPEPADALTVMSFNIASAHWCQQADGCLYDDPDFMLNVVAQLIVDNGVDVVGLQEVERFTLRHAGVDMVASLQQKLQDLGYPMQAWFEARNPGPVGVNPGEFGIALLSRVPATSYSFTMHASSIHAASAPVQEAVFAIDGTVVRVYNTHAYVQGSCDVIDPGMVTPVQDHLAEFTILIGDFNDRLDQSSPCMMTLLQTHQSACLESADPICDPGVDTDMHPNYVSNVDHVMFRFAAGGTTTFLDGWVDPTVNDDVPGGYPEAYPHPNWVSDHYPIFGRFDLNTPPAFEPLGDVSCDGRMTILDALFIAQHDASLRRGSETCPLEQPNEELYLPAADVNRDERVNIIDALFIAQCDVGVTNPYCWPT